MTWLSFMISSHVHCVLYGTTMVLSDGTLAKYWALVPVQVCLEFVGRSKLVPWVATNQPQDTSIRPEGTHCNKNIRVAKPQHHSLFAKLKINFFIIQATQLPIIHKCTINCNKNDGFRLVFFQALYKCYIEPVVERQGPREQLQALNWLSWLGNSGSDPSTCSEAPMRFVAKWHCVTLRVADGIFGIRKVVIDFKMIDFEFGLSTDAWDAKNANQRVFR